MIETPLGTVHFSGSPHIAPIAAPTHDYGPATVYAAVWQLAGPLPDVTLTAHLTDIPSDADGGGDAGERLDAITYERPGCFVTFGGPDVELLHAHTGTFLPERWADLIPPDFVAGCPYGTFVEDAGLLWRLPALDHGESLILCVTVAWSETEMAAWSAVDLCAMHPDRVLAQLA